MTINARKGFVALSRTAAIGVKTIIRPSKNCDER
jgi:hypothetical protein